MEYAAEEVVGPISDAQRLSLQRRLADSFTALLFHREGYRPCHMPQHVVESIAAVMEAKAFAHVVTAAELGMSSGSQVLRIYAKEASSLLLAEVEKYCMPLEGPVVHSSSGNEVDIQQLSLNEISGGLRSIHTVPTHQQRPNRSREAVWGWLVPGSRMLPYVVLKGAGVAIGRGKEALWAVGSAGSHAGTPVACLTAGNDRQLTEVLKRNLGFVEVADGRVSRLHCIISLDYGPDGNPAAILEDCSSNGTFLNHKKLGKGESAVLVDGDHISLVLSVAPLVEQYFTFRSGDPRDGDLNGSDEHSWMGSTHSTAGVFSPGAMHSASPVGMPPSAIFRTATSRYTTAEQSTLEDLKCQICLNTLRQCVALEPCGHNFCATCLSHHLGNQLQSGLQMSCPFRCPPPERIIINYAVRALIDLLSTSARPISNHNHVGRNVTAASNLSRMGSRPGANGSTQGAFGHAGGSSSNLSAQGPTSPAPAAWQQHQQQPQQQQQQQHHQHTPTALANSSSAAVMARTASAASTSSFDAGAAAALANLPGVPEGRSRVGTSGGQREPSRTELARTESLDPDYYTQSMSVLCPLNDEYLPMEAANLKTRQVDVALSQLKISSLPVEDHLVCLEALARLAWSDDAIREQVAASGGVRSLVDVMALHSGSDSIQCNGCLALMSLVRGEGEVCQSNQWHIAKAGAIELIASTMGTFRGNAMVQLSVLLCLIPLALENAMMQAHITQECLPLIIAALDRHRDEVDIQTKGLVLLGVLIQGDDAVHDAIRIRELEAAVPRRVAAALRLHAAVSDDVLWAALFVLAVLARDTSCVFSRASSALAWAGVLRVLEAAVEQYKQRHEAEHIEPDEMIVSAGDYLVRVLEPVQRRHDTQIYLLAATAGVGLICCAGWLARRWSSSDTSSSGVDGTSQPNLAAAVATIMTLPVSAKLRRQHPP